MELYRVLLVDDEEDIRVGISRKMDWSGLGFELVGEAENGRDALELAESLQPDVVLTDIKMPFMDGLELCRILTERLPASKFVVFSGFDDFEYAKQAIQMNVSEYILKPINAPELTAVLERLHSQLDAERARLPAPLLPQHVGLFRLMQTRAAFPRGPASICRRRRFILRGPHRDMRSAGGGPPAGGRGAGGPAFRPSRP